MRIKLLFLMMCLLCSACLFADSELLPEKSDSTSQTQQVQLRDDADDETRWGTVVVVTIILGFVFLLIEILVLPGFEVAGITGLLLLLVAVVISYLKLSTAVAIASAVIAFSGLAMIIIWFIFIFPKTQMGKSFVLNSASTKENGYVAVEDKTRYIGVEGVTTTPLKPSGFMRANDERLDVTSECEFVEKGVEVRVVRVNNGRLIVSPSKRDE